MVFKNQLLVFIRIFLKFIFNYLKLNLFPWHFHNNILTLVIRKYFGHFQELKISQGVLPLPTEHFGSSEVSSINYKWGVSLKFRWLKFSFGFCLNGPTGETDSWPCPPVGPCSRTLSFVLSWYIVKADFTVIIVTTIITIIMILQFK